MKKSEPSYIESAEAQQYIVKKLKQWQTFKQDFKALYIGDTSKWLFLFVWRDTYYDKKVPDYMEEYAVSDLNEAQDLIDYYRWQKSHVKLIVRDSGEDVTNKLTFNSGANNG